MANNPQYGRGFTRKLFWNVLTGNLTTRELAKAHDVPDDAFAVWEQAFWNFGLSSIVDNSDNIRGVLAVSSAGNFIAASIPEKIETERFKSVAADIAECASISSEHVRMTERGALQQIYVKAQFGYVIIQRFANEIILAFIASERAKLGLIFSDLHGGGHSTPLHPTPEPILPPKPPKTLTAHAKSPDDEEY